LLRHVTRRPIRVLMTVDAVGGVWRYAMDVARQMAGLDATMLLVGLGPPPDPAQRAEAGLLPGAELRWIDAPLDWMATDVTELDVASRALEALADAWRADLLHLNLPSQAAGVSDAHSVIAVSHSCVPTWWHAVRGTPLPAAWDWHVDRNRAGLARADAVIVPSASHGESVARSYGPLPRLHVVHNGSDVAARTGERADCVFAVARWWDDAKGGATLDAAASLTAIPVRMAGAAAGPNRTAMHLDHAEALGPLPHCEVIAQMRRAAIFAAPSRYEPFGLAVVEAARCGAALVLADIPTFRELWSDAAVFVPAEAPLAWARAFDSLAADPALRGTLAVRARQRAAEYTLDRQAESLHRIYGETLARAGAGVAVH
jgi:glycosyltransferase involved in cell wall biosynthesis